MPEGEPKGEPERKSNAERRPRTEQVMAGILQIDTMLAGDREFNAVYLIEAKEPALIEAGPAADTPLVLEALEAAGVGPEDLAHIVVTHIHLDHAGGVGGLVRRFPRATVWVHERGAPHLVDPTRLVASTARTYGEVRMLELYGSTEPVAAERIRQVTDGDKISLGDRILDVIGTPGHASHHLAFSDGQTGAVFTGEAVGSHLPWADCYRPALPPPEVDVEAALDSIERIRGLHAAALLTSHFGAIADSVQGCDRASQRIRAWTETTRRVLEATKGAGSLEVANALRAQAAEEFLLDSGRPIDMARYNLIGSIEMNAAGLTRYWRKRWEAEQLSPTS